MLAGAMFAAVAALPARAQEEGAPPAGGRGAHRAEAAAHMREISDKLGLTPDQQKVFADSMRDEHEKMKALKDDSAVEGKAKRKQAMQIHSDAIATRRASLTEDQKPKFDALQAEMHEKMRKRRGAGAEGGDGMMPPPPPPPGV